MSTRISIVREKGQKLPEPALKFLLETTAAHTLGVAVPDGEGEIASYRCGQNVDLKNMFEQCEGDESKTFYVVNNDESVKESDLQPFTLVKSGEGEKDVPVLVAIIDADVTEEFNMKDDTAVTPQYFFNELFLQPLVDEIAEMAGDGGYPRMMELLAKKENRDKIKSKITNGVVMLIPVTGISIAIASEGFEGSKSDWGWSSKALSVMKSTPKIIMKPKGSEEKKELPEGGTPVNTEVPPEELYAKLLSADKRFHLHNSILHGRPAPGSDVKEARGTWVKNSALPIPKKGDVVDSSLLYLGFPWSSIKAGSPLYESYSKHMGDPKTAASEQGPSEPPVKEKKPPDEEVPQTLHIPANIKATYLKLKGEGKLVPTTTEKLEKTVKEYPRAHIQLDESAAVFLDMGEASLNRLPGHIKTCLLNDWRLQIKGLIELTKATTTAKPKITMERKAS